MSEFGRKARPHGLVSGCPTRRLKSAVGNSIVNSTHSREPKALLSASTSGKDGVYAGSVASRITVAMITKNEARAVRKVIDDIKAVVPNAEIVIVDSSSDETAEIAQSLGARVIRQFPPRGQGPAMDAALRMSDREVIVTLDCDDTYPVEFIEPMARLVLCEGYDLSRWLSPGWKASCHALDQFSG